MKIEDAAKVRCGKCNKIFRLAYTERLGYIDNTVIIKFFFVCECEHKFNLTQIVEFD